MFGKFFQYDNAFWRFMGLLGDLMLLNLLLLLTMLPVVTAGAGLSAAYYTCCKMIEKRDTGTIRDFAHAFRLNLMHGIVLTLCFLVLGFALAADGRILFTILGAGQTAGAAFAGSTVLACLLVAVFILGLFLYAAVFLYVFPLEARFYNRITELFRNALILSLTNLPRTVLMILGDAVLFAVIYLSFVYFPGFAVLPLLFCLPLAVYFNTWMLKPVLGLAAPEDERAQNTN